MTKYADAAAKFIKASSEPFFLAVNFPDAHFPLLRQQYGLPHKPLEAKDVKALPFIGADTARLRQSAADYYNCLMRLDAGVGMLLERLERSKKAERTAYSAGTFFPQRTLRDERYKLIVNLTSDRENPVADAYLHQRGTFFKYGTTSAELDLASDKIRSAYATWRSPPKIEFYDLKNDPWEFENLAESESHRADRQRLADALRSFRTKHGDPLLDGKKLRQLTLEHNRVANTLQGGRYSKEQDWQYTSYLYELAP